MNCSAAAALLLATALLPGAALAQPSPPLRVHVRGGAELHAIAGNDHGKLLLRGELVDDTGGPIPHAALVVHALTENSHTALHLALSPCEGSHQHAARRASNDITTDNHGSFCATGALPTERLVVRLQFRGDQLHDATNNEIRVDQDAEPRDRVRLHFEAMPERVDLDRDVVTVIASLRLERGNAMGPNLTSSAQRTNLPLVLEDERHVHLADAVTSGDGRARFEVHTAALAGPGLGELTVRFDGNAVLANATEAKPVVRRAVARLALTRPLAPGDPEEGIAIDVDVVTNRGPAQGGVVEVRHALAAAYAGAVMEELSDSVGTATVDEHGHARILATFSAPGGSEVPLRMRYLPAAPWYQASPDVEIQVTLAEPSPLRRILVVSAALAAAAWVASGWRRAPRPPAGPQRSRTVPPPSGRAGIDIVSSTTPLSGWRGTVRDAHDNRTIAGAQLTIVVPSFTGDGVVAQAISDADGAFLLEGSHPSGARLVVRSSEHATHEQVLPPPSILHVSLVTRRRALVERLVQWARRRGAPFDHVPEPTPGHVRRAAERMQAWDIEHWATRIEHAAYGVEPLSDALEQDLRGIAAAEPLVPVPGHEASPGVPPHEPSPQSDAVAKN